MQSNCFRGRVRFGLAFVTVIALTCNAVRAQEIVYTTFGDFPNSAPLRVSSSMFSPDGTKAALPATQNGQEFMSVNGQPGPLFDRLIRYAFAWTGGNRIVYFGERGGKELCVVDGKETPLAGRIYRFAPVVAVSADGSRFAYVETTQRQKRLVLDGKPRSWHSGVGYFQFGAQSKHYRYVIYDGREVSAVINETKQAVFDGVTNLFVSDDGKVVGYLAELKDGSYPIINGKIGRRIESVRDFVISPDGRNLLISEYRLSALTGSLLLTLNGKSILPPLAENAILYDVKFSADSKRYGFAYPSNEIGDFAVWVDNKSIAFPGYVLALPSHEKS